MNNGLISSDHVSAVSRISGTCKSCAEDMSRLVTLTNFRYVGRKILSQEIYHKYLPFVLLKTQEIRVDKQIHIMILNLHYAVTVYVIIINYTNSNNINDNRIVLVMILQMTLSLMSQLPCKQLTLVFISINYEDDNLIAVVIMITVVKLMVLTLK